MIPDFIDSGFDILNPMQTSAAGMDPSALKDRFGDRITFWGGGIDTQHTLPFGTPQEVMAEVQERMRILAPGGGFVFNTVHNVQARVPPENLLALYRAVQEYRGRPWAKGENGGLIRGRRRREGSASGTGASNWAVSQAVVCGSAGTVCTC